jgi:hypothetical protein
MTPEQLQILQHSLGLDQYGQCEMRDGYYPRNYFCAGYNDAETCRSLVALGYMAEYQASELTGGDPLFRVTKQGENAVKAESPTPPKLTRGQRRYRQFLHADTGRSFAEWLRDGAWKVTV